MEITSFDKYAFRDKFEDILNKFFEIGPRSSDFFDFYENRLNRLLGSQIRFILRNPTKIY